MASVHRKRDDKNEKDRLDIVRALPRACTDEVAAVEFMESKRWNGTPACPRCGDTDVYQMRDRVSGERNKRFLWLCRGCRRQFTVRVGTVFEDSKIELRHWCFAFWAACAGKKGVSALQIRRQCQISYKSALFLMHRIRYAMAPDAPTAPKLTGTVEADETWVGGKPRSQGRDEWLSGKRRSRGPFYEKTPVMAMVERGGQVRAQVVADVTAKTVRSVLLANVSPEANLRTDDGSHYAAVGRRFRSHETVRHGIHEYVRGDASVNAAESFFARLKRQLFGTHHAVSRRHLHRYVAEVAFKHNTRKLDDGERVLAAIRAADGKRLHYREPRSNVLASCSDLSGGCFAGRIASNRARNVEGLEPNGAESSSRSEIGNEFAHKRVQKSDTTGLDILFDRHVLLARYDSHQTLNGHVQNIERVLVGARLDSKLNNTGFAVPSDTGLRVDVDLQFGDGRSMRQRQVISAMVEQRTLEDYLPNKDAGLFARIHSILCRVCVLGLRCGLVSYVRDGHGAHNIGQQLLDSRTEVHVGVRSRSHERAGGGHGPHVRHRKERQRHLRRGVIESYPQRIANSFKRLKSGVVEARLKPRKARLTDPGLLRELCLC
jgi:transposase-like protein